MTTTNLPARVDEDADLLERVLADGDISRLTPPQRVAYYRMRCDAAGLDHRAQPFQFLNLQGKLVLYATRAATQQLAAKHKISTQIVSRTTEDGLHVVVVRASSASGSTDEIGAVAVSGLKGEALANAYMKAATKGKRRAVLALCGLGEMDELEVDSVPRASRVEVDLDTGEIPGVAPVAAPVVEQPKAAPNPKPAPPSATTKPAAQKGKPAAPDLAVLKKQIAEMREIAAAEWRPKIDHDVKDAGDDVGKLMVVAAELRRALNEAA